MSTSLMGRFMLQRWRFYFADVTFKNCKFVLGNDPRSQQLLNALKRSQGHATSILLAENRHASLIRLK